MVCDDVQERLSEYIDKQLDGERKTTVEEHLSSCSNCQSLLETLSHTVRLLAAEPEVEPPFAMRTRVMAGLEEAQDKRSIWDWFFTPFRISIPIQAASVVAVAVLAVFLYNQERPSDEVRRYGSTGSGARPADESQRKTEDMRGQAGQGEAGQGSRAQVEAAINYQIVVRVSASDTAVVPSDGRSRALFKPAPVLSQQDLQKWEEARRLAIQTGQPQSVLITISPDQLEKFKDQLEASGNIESESAMTPNKTPGAAISPEKLTILVTLKPDSPQPSPTAR